jgi:hypothetical protein
VRTLALKDLTADRVLKLAGEVDIYLPPSVKEVWVEKWQPETADLEQEIRAFTVQQAVYWVLAAAILMYVRVKT